MLAGKPYEAKFEFDLFGTGVDAGQTTFRVRHMYAKWGPFLAGQTNTLFMDGDIFPNVIDYWGPTGMVFVRTPQIRWTFLDSDGWTAAVALEHPSDDIDPGNIRLIDENIAANIQANEELPDLTAAVRYGGDWGHVRLAGILRKIGYDTRGTEDNEPDGQETGWGVNATTAIKLGLATPRLGVVYGRGIATYMNDGGMDLAPAVSTIFEPPSVILVPRGRGGEAARRFRLCRPAMGEEVELGDRLQLHQGRQHQLPGRDRLPQGRICVGEPALDAGRQRSWPALELLWGKRTDNDGDTGTDTAAAGQLQMVLLQQEYLGLVRIGLGARREACWRMMSSTDSSTSRNAVAKAELLGEFVP